MLIDPATYGILRGNPDYTRFLEEFYSEASLLSSLRHVNIIRMYGVATDLEGIPWILMEPGDMSLDTVMLCCV